MTELQFFNPTSLFPLILKICPEQRDKKWLSCQKFIENSPSLPPWLWKYHVQDKWVKMTELLKFSWSSIPTLVPLDFENIMSRTREKNDRVAKHFFKILRPYSPFTLKISCPGQWDKNDWVAKKFMKILHSYYWLWKYHVQGKGIKMTELLKNFLKILRSYNWLGKYHVQDKRVKQWLSCKKILEKIFHPYSPLTNPLTLASLVFFRPLISQTYATGPAGYIPTIRYAKIVQPQSLG